MKGTVLEMQYLWNVLSMEVTAPEGYCPRELLFLEGAVLDR